MRLIISESQLKRIISEQSEYEMDRRSNALLNLVGLRSDDDYNTVNQINKMAATPTEMERKVVRLGMEIGATFLPYVGPYIGAMFAAEGAVENYEVGNYKTAALFSVFASLPLIGPITRLIPNATKLGSQGMEALAAKISKGEALTSAETQIANAVKGYAPEIQKELTKLAPKFKSIANEVQVSKAAYIQKYGEQKYNELLVKYLYNGIDKESFISTLKNVKNPNIKIKPIFGGGADHRVFQSATRADEIIKAELRPGEVNLWIDTFKKYPNVFAKVIKKAKVKGTDGAILDAVVLEKLDTKPFETFWSDMEKTLFNMEKQTPGSPMLGVEYTLKHIKEPFYKNLWNNFTNYVKQNNGQISGKVDELNKLIDELYKITPKPDIRKFNFGYDKSGVLKALDL